MIVALSLIALKVATSMQVAPTGQENVARFDGDVMLCYQVAEKKQWALVREDKYRHLENYLLKIVIKKDTIAVFFDPKRTEVGNSLSRLGMGFEILVDRKTKRIIQVSTID
jgi:hypothetical protein